MAGVEDLVSADLTVAFDPAVLGVRGAHVGVGLSEWTVLARIVNRGEIRVSLVENGDGSASEITGSTTLVVLEFDVVGGQHSVTTLHLADVTLNGGAILVETTDGSFVVGPDPWQAFVPFVSAGGGQASAAALVHLTAPLHTAPSSGKIKGF